MGGGEIRVCEDGATEIGAAEIGAAVERLRARASPVRAVARPIPPAVDPPLPPPGAHIQFRSLCK